MEGQTYWVLLVSMGTDEASGRSVTQYFIGDFDGRRFSAWRAAEADPGRDDAERPTASRLLDDGTDQYATVGFSGVTHPILMGWAMNWGYAEATPTVGYCGQMTSPRHPYLYRDRRGFPAVGLWPVPISEALVDHRVEGAVHAEDTVYTLDDQPHILILTPAQDDPALSIIFSNALGDRLLVTQDAARTLTVDRSETHLPDDVAMLQDPQYRLRRVEARTKLPGPWLIMLDGPVLEVYADGGTRTLTMVQYPRRPYDTLTVCGTGPLEVTALRPYEAPLPDDPYRYRAIFT